MIVVAGMHRSGTSAICNVLFDAGVDMGDPGGFYAADEWNRRGYFEQADVLDFNHRVLAGVGRDVRGALWGQARYLAIPGRAQVATRFAGLAGEARGLAAGYRGVTVKDPRFCMTLGEWRGLGEVEGVVVCLRHPWASVRSLQRRQSIPTALGFRFWDAHMSRLLRSLEGVPRVLWVDYERLMRGVWEPDLSRIRAFFGLSLSVEELEERARGVLDPSLRNVSGSEDAGLPPRVRMVWARLRRRARAAA